MSFFYAVKKGHAPDIYSNWEDCQKQIDGFSGAEFKKFKTMEEATVFIQEPLEYLGGGCIDAGANLPVCYKTRAM